MFDAKVLINRLPSFSVNVKSSCFDRLFHIAVANADIGSLKCHLQFLNKCLCHRLVKFKKLSDNPN